MGKSGKKKKEVIKFGTDGWRAVIGDTYTYENVQVAAQAIAEYVKTHKNDAKRKSGRGVVALGYDTRFQSDKFAELAACVLAANGVKVILANGPTPTPAVSYLIQRKGLTGGVMITASHNPPQYNGIKYKAYYAGSAGSDIIEKIESRLRKSAVKTMLFDEAIEKRKIVIEDMRPAHKAFLRSYLNMSLLKRSPLKVLVDIMYGTGDDYIAGMLAGTRVKVTTMHTEANTSFGGINPEPIEKNLRELIRETKRGRFDIGVATDGDADRVGAASPDGRIISSHTIMALILLHFVEDKGYRGEVVKTISGSTLLDRICQKHRLKMHETPVGFKYVAELMMTRNVLIGGEESGGIGFKGYMPERDGTLSAILLLEMMAHRRKGILQILKDVEEVYGKFRYGRIDTHYPEDKKARLIPALKKKHLKKILGKDVACVKSYDGIKLIRSDDSWLLLRLSGTEPILRIYAEASSDKEVARLLAFGKKVANNI
ncbi:MAG: phosphoglucomutase/phosphomannomutase family protein [Candidatus Omnitrophica bacterium]|nr:phosphoglucomutase/phosphomannomutase family protein [Candidatus Omnitrophota bacterium]